MKDILDALIRGFGKRKLVVALTSLAAILGVEAQAVDGTAAFIVAGALFVVDYFFGRENDKRTRNGLK